jgi:peptidyl-prolyl cis-trans isomerase SurA
MRLLFIIVVAGLNLQIAARAEVQLRNGIAAIVNDAIITRLDLEQYTAQAIDLLQRSYRGQPEVYRQRRDEAIKDGLDQLVERQLILDDFKSLGGILPESVIDDRIKEIIRQTYGDRAGLTRSLQSRGTTFEDFRKRTRDEIVLRYMNDHNVSSAILISPAKIEKYYTNHIDRYRLGDQVKLRTLVLNRTSGSSPREIARLALEIRSKVESGASFAEMATIYSEGSAKEAGGDWGWVEQTGGEGPGLKLNKGLSEIAFVLKPGQLSPVLALARESNDDYWIVQFNQDGTVAKARKYTGHDVFIEEKDFKEPAAGGDLSTLPAPQLFYVMLVEATRPARTQTLDEMRDDIEKELVIEERSRLRNKWIERLKQKAFIRYF